MSVRLKLSSDWLQDGEVVSVRLKIGEMSCLEYAAMKGYTELLLALLSHSVCVDMLRTYFSLDGTPHSLLAILALHS